MVTPERVVSKFASYYSDLRTSVLVKNDGVHVTVSQEFPLKGATTRDILAFENKFGRLADGFMNDLAITIADEAPSFGRDENGDEALMVVNLEDWMEAASVSDGGGSLRFVATGIIRHEKGLPFPQKAVFDAKRKLD